MPSSPFTTAPGTRANASHTESRRPSVCPAPSIWNAAVAAPQRKPSGISTRPVAVAGFGGRGADGTKLVMVDCPPRGRGVARGRAGGARPAGRSGHGGSACRGAGTRTAALRRRAAALDGALHDSRPELAAGEGEGDDEGQGQEEEPRQDERVVDVEVRPE